VHPEHRDIAVAAVERLTVADQRSLRELWDLGRPAFRGRLCPAPSMGDQGPTPPCLDLAAFSALAGDHACSPRDLVEQVLPSSWVLGVAEVSAQLKSALAAETTPEAHANRLTTSNLQLQRVDEDYAGRAGANNAHFLLARSDNDLADYLEHAVRPGTPLNALGLYLQYHGAAVGLAGAVLAERDDGRRATLARDTLALEGFAEHWLEDAFAAGHVVGTWGSAAWRKGTHDHYNVHGFDTQTWAGERVVLHGDANARPADLERASTAVARSLAEVVTAFRQPGVAAPRFGPDAAEMFAFDACQALEHPLGAAPGEAGGAAALLEHLPVAARGADDVHPPRFRDELGLFLGAFASGTGGLNLGPEGLSEPRPTFSLGAGLRVGFAAPGITGTIGTAKAFLELGLTLQSAQLQRCYDSCDQGALTVLLPRVPARSGIRLGLRLPFYLIPGDLLILAPLLLPFSQGALARVALAAISGGLLPYERSVLTPAGVFQVIVGRELDLTFFGYTSDVLEVLRLGTLPDGTGDYALAQVRSIRLSFPLVEWTPFRSFATNLTFGVPIQVGLGVEVPTSTRVVIPASGVSTTAPLTWTLFLRVQSDIQNFLGERED
jgi:hypothetical protein